MTKFCVKLNISVNRNGLITHIRLTIYDVKKSMICEQRKIGVKIKILQYKISFRSFLSTKTYSPYTYVQIHKLKKGFLFNSQGLKHELYVFM